MKFLLLEWALTLIPQMELKAFHLPGIFFFLLHFSFFSIGYEKFTINAKILFPENTYSHIHRLVHNFQSMIFPNFSAKTPFFSSIVKWTSLFGDSFKIVYINIYLQVFYWELTSAFPP